jgi:L-arabinose isomerase
MDFAGMVGVEFLLIDKDTNLHDFRNEIRWNEVYYHIEKGL